MTFTWRRVSVSSPSGFGRPRANISCPSCPSLPRLVRLAAQQAQPQAAGHVLDLQRYQLGVAERAGEADQQQRAVAPAAGGAVARRKELAQQGQGEGRALPHRAAALGQQALQRLLDVAVPGTSGQVVEPVHLAQGCQAAADGGWRVAVLQAGQVGADGRGRGGHRGKPQDSAPGGVVRSVRLVGPQRRGCGVRAPARRPAPPGRLPSAPGRRGCPCLAGPHLAWWRGRW